jgi:hypothetical protein
VLQLDPLESAKAKLDRAYYHLERLQDEIHSDGNSKAYGISFRHELQTDELVIFCYG